MAKILVIEDDTAISDIVCSTLSGEGHECTPAYSGSEAKLLLANLDDKGTVKDAGRANSSFFSFDLVICDLMLPGSSGEEVITLIREMSIAPILVMSAKAEVKDRVALLRQGVDDYLVKPFDLDELVARVEALLRRACFSQSASLGKLNPDNLHTVNAATFSQNASSRVSSSDKTLTFGKWVLSESRRLLEVNGKPVRLTRTEFDILDALMHHPQKVFTKRELYEAAWHEEALVEEKAINTHISNIRSKLKETGTDTYIETVWGIGFKLTDL